MSDADAPKLGGRFPTIMIVIAGMLAGLFMLPFGFGVRAFRMPSGSMQPALYAGDNFVVTKWSYGYGRYSFMPFPGVPGGRLFANNPRRGDLVVFRPVPQPDRDFVKRVIGLPGDRVQMIDGVLHLNGAPVPREDLGEVSFTDENGATINARSFRETLPDGGGAYVVLDRGGGELDNTPEYVVPQGHIFLLGDDRDNSADSRVPAFVGYVPMDNLVGRVAWIFETSPAQRLRAE
ncbi:MAG: signal peptidase I [Terricaulis sp.]